MTSSQFDALIRCFQIGTARRSAISATFGTGLGVLLSRFGHDAADAGKRRRKKKKCKGGKKKCGKKCVDLATDGNHCGVCGNACATGACIHGACTCVNGDECPEGCLCASREEDLPDGCQSGVDTTDTCNEDADCPFGSFCRGVGNQCSIPCFV